jgi:putative tricarboxylic transport membrane protein
LTCLARLPGILNPLERGHRQAVGAVGGAYIPMLTLSIPGDAVIIGALYIHGMKPGPMMLLETPHLFWYTVGNLTLTCLWLAIFGFTGIKVFAKIVEMPKSRYCR